MARYLYSELATLIQARQNSIDEWHKRHTDTIERLVDQLMPSGSGFDSGTKLDLDSSHADKLVFDTSFHHMNDGGFYDGWTWHRITVTPSLAHRYNLRISGRNRNNIKEHIHQVFMDALDSDVTYWLFLPRYPELAVTSKWEEKDGSPSQCYQAFYVGSERFWNDGNGAILRAGELMEAKFYAKEK